MTAVEDRIVIEDQVVVPLLSAMLVCLCTEVDRSPGGPTCFCGLVPGQLVAMDFVDCTAGSGGCGMAWVRLDATYPSVKFPNPDQTATCRSPMAARVQLGVIRCMPGMDAEGNPPDEAAQYEAVRVQMGDRAALVRAVECCLDRPHRDYVLGGYVPAGPSGGAGGGALTVTIRL